MVGNFIGRTLRITRSPRAILHFKNNDSATRRAVRPTWSLGLVGGTIRQCLLVGQRLRAASGTVDRADEVSPVRRCDASG
jgi:hypothetical protein